MPASKLFKFIAGALLTLALCALVYWALSSVFSAGYQAGHNQVLAEWQSEKNNLLERVKELTEQTATIQHELDTLTANFERTSNEEKQALRVDFERRLADARKQRVYIPAKPPADYSDTARAGATSPIPTIREARCELDPAVVADLAAIARDGDIAIIERNELIDRYNAGRDALNQQKAVQ